MPSKDGDVKLNSFSSVLYNIISDYGCDNIILGGDFNARIGNLNSFNNEDLFEGSFLFNFRSSLDTVTNNRGIAMVDIMESYGFNVCNGRSTSDTPANYTFISEIGCSIVDYVWFNINCLSIIKDFKVVNVSDYSDHFSCVIKILVNECPSDSLTQVQKNVSFPQVNRSIDNLIKFNLILEHHNNLYYNSGSPEELYNNFYTAVFLQ